jgi:hypothetical protein
LFGVFPRPPGPIALAALALAGAQRLWALRGGTFLLGLAIGIYLLSWVWV